MKSIALLFFLSILSIISYGQSSNITPDQWREDIDYLSEQVAKTFPKYEGSVKANFDKEKAKLLSNLKELDRRETVNGIRKLLATTHDEGNNFSVFQSAIDFKVIPLKTLLLDDGLIVCDAGSQHKALVGKRIIAIDGQSIATIKQKLSPLTSKDNEHYLNYILPLYVITPELWMDEPLIEEYKVELHDGTSHTISLELFDSYRALSRNLPSHRKSPFTDNDYSGRNYWYEYDTNSKILLIQFLGIYKNDNDPPFGKFVKSIEQELDKRDIDKVIIDNRYGGGGNGFALKPFTDLMANHSKLSESRKLFVLTNNSTRGTVTELTSILELNTKAILIGKSTGEGPNTVGDTKVITLPNSGIKMTLTHTLWNTSWETDPRKTLSPGVEVKYTSEDYINQKDPWIEEVNRFNIENTPQPNSVPEGLIGTYTFGGRKVTISSDKGDLKMTMNRKIKNFFELNTTLYPQESGKMSTDIKDVYLNYKANNGRAEVVSIYWKGATLMKE